MATPAAGIASGTVATKCFAFPHKVHLEGVFAQVPVLLKGFNETMSTIYLVKACGRMD
jgi:hypothetical protein